MLTIDFFESNIDCLNHLQWPDNYDFAETRAINLPVVKTTIRYVDNLEIEKKEIPVGDVSDDGDTDFDNDFDPSGLKKAFRFAAWSSVIMVRFIRNRRCAASLIIDLCRRWCSWSSYRFLCLGPPLCTASLVSPSGSSLVFCGRSVPHLWS